METTKVNAELQTQDAASSPSGLKILWREIVRDKVALISLIFLVLISSFVFGTSLILDQDEIVTVDLFAIHEPPGEDFILGTDYGGRDVFGQLIIGTRNSLLIGILVTAIAGIAGILVGLFSGYFGGHADNALMRVVDFFMVLPTLMIIIVFVTIYPGYSIWAFSFIMAAFL